MFKFNFNLVSLICFNCHQSILSLDQNSDSPRIADEASGTEIASFPIYKVLFCARGREGSVESDCFSFTESYRSSEDFQIHVFSCHIIEAVSYLLVFHITIRSPTWLSLMAVYLFLALQSKIKFVSTNI